MGFPSVEYFWENSGCHVLKILLENVIICACIDTTTLPTSVAVNHTAHSLEQVCLKCRRTFWIQIPATIHVTVMQPSGPIHRSYHYQKNATGLCVKLTALLQVYQALSGPCLSLPGSLFQLVQLPQQLPNENMAMNGLFYFSLSFV